MLKLSVLEPLRSAICRNLMFWNCAPAATTAALDCACAVSVISSSSASAVAAPSMPAAVVISWHRARKSVSSGVSVSWLVNATQELSIATATDSWVGVRLGRVATTLEFRVKVMGAAARSEVASTVMAPLSVTVTVLLDWPLASVTVDAEAKVPLDVVQSMVAPTTGALVKSRSSTIIGSEGVPTARIWPSPLISTTVW